MIRQPVCQFSHRPTHKVCVASDCKRPPWICKACRGKCLHQHGHDGKPVMAFVWEDIEPLLNKVVKNNGFLCSELDNAAERIEQLSRKSVDILFSAIAAIKNTKQRVTIKDPYRKTLDKLKSVDGSATLTGQDISRLMEAAQTSTLLQDSQQVMKQVLQKISKLDALVSSLDKLLSDYSQGSEVKAENEKWQQVIQPYRAVLPSTQEPVRVAFVKSYSVDYQRELGETGKTIQTEKGNPSFYNTRGIAFKNKGEYEKAIEDYTTAIGLKKFSSYYYNRAIAYKQLGEFHKSIDDFTEAIRLDPEGSEFYNGRGVVKRALKQFQSALQDYDRAIQLKPTVDDYYTNRAVTLAGLGRLQQALLNLSKAIELQPADPANYKNRAAVYDKLGKASEAEADRKKMKELEAARQQKK